MSVTLVLPREIADDLRTIAALPVETGGVLLVSVVQTPDGNMRLLARKMLWVKDSAYIRRGRDKMAITSEGYVPFLAEAEALGATAIWVHTHPGIGGIPCPSQRDEEVDRQIADLFRLRSGSVYYATLIFSPCANDLVFTGYIQSENAPRFSIDRAWNVGDRLRLARAFDQPTANISAIFDRNVRAFGGAVQHALSDLRVGIVGCGGTGSAVAEQLVRLGVRHFTLIDPDRLSESNITRVYGSTPADVNQFKADVLARHLSLISPDSQCDVVKSMITLQSVAYRLTSCDIVFGCTDDNAGRLVLSRFSTYFLTPVIDCGVLLSSTANGNLLGIDGRVTTLVPGQACLLCRDRIDLARAAAELLTPAERLRRENEGYAPALGQTEPAVVSFTTLVAATAVGELLERFIGYGPERRPSEVLLRCHEREISTNLAAPRGSHYCHPSSGKLGIGNTDPFLDQIWPD
jgi:molybdopterin/thiamine biosynthesis adenylyltransferase